LSSEPRAAEEASTQRKEATRRLDPSTNIISGPWTHPAYNQLTMPAAVKGADPAGREASKTEQLKLRQELLARQGRDKPFGTVAESLKWS
jgi:hypothetical protein